MPAWADGDLGRAFREAERAIRDAGPGWRGLGLTRTTDGYEASVALTGGGGPHLFTRRSFRAVRGDPVSALEELTRLLDEYAAGTSTAVRYVKGGPVGA